MKPAKYIYVPIAIMTALRIVGFKKFFITMKEGGIVTLPVNDFYNNFNK